VAALDLTTRRLTPQQRVAAATSLRNVFIEAEPGSGKTTVAAQRFGVLRYAAGADERAVVAVSFTRSATSELRARVKRSWGPSALAWPHRISTIDFLMRRLVTALMAGGHISWPGGHVELDVIDDWRSITESTWHQTETRVGLVQRQVVVSWGQAVKRWPRPTVAAVQGHVGDGICTHDDIRSVLADALEDPELAQLVRERLRSSVRALIVDEVFDANELDLAIVELAMDAGLEVTIIGDPWQALYAFRGAKPHLVPELVRQTHMSQLPLTASFRWETDEQRQLAAHLRQKVGVVLPTATASEVDVVLASQWKYLWAIDEVLPLAFAPGANDEGKAAETVLLDLVARSALQMDAAAIGESLKALGISEGDLRDAEPALGDVIEALRAPELDATRVAFGLLSDALQLVMGRPLGQPVHDDLLRLRDLRARLLASTVVPGLTTHQAKGREWATVGVRLDAKETRDLQTGLVPTLEPNRKTYVACTRARRHTFSV
jgi:DNA helicase-2/ATP-dependent DNA helicase PcrA